MCYFFALTLTLAPLRNWRVQKKERPCFQDLSTNNNKLKNLTLPVSSGWTNPLTEDNLFPDRK
jgi:hypothetical protein